MKRIILFVCLLLTLTIAISLAEGTSVDLTSLNTAELNSFIADIENTIELYHEPDSDAKDDVLSLVEKEVESHFDKKGIDISWAWIDYSYTKEWDFYTLKTHIDYKDDTGKYKPDVYAEVFSKDGELSVFYLSVGSEVIVDERNALPETLWEELPKEVINTSTGIDISQMNLMELKELKEKIKEEIENNHEPDYKVSELVLSLTKSEVENHFITSDEDVSWPWFDYTYTREWDFYTLTTSIDHGDLNDAVVYSEAYPIDGKYELFYLSIDEEIILDSRDKLPENLLANTEKTSTDEKVTVAATETPTAAPEPTATIEPTATPEPVSTPEPTATPEPILLQKGSKGEDVKKIQLRLIELGYLKGAADGDYGNQTKAAVEAFQRASSLEVTGVITNIEMAKLLASPSEQVANEPIEVSGNLTVENCELLAQMLQAKNPGNLVGQFMTKYKGRTIEFDGNIAYHSNHGSYNTRFDFLIYAGDFSTTSVSGPNFQFRDVNYYDLNLVGSNAPDSVHSGQNYHIVAEVVKYDAGAELIILEPVSMRLR